MLFPAKVFTEISSKKTRPFRNFAESIGTGKFAVFGGGHVQIPAENLAEKVDIVVTGQLGDLGDLFVGIGEQTAGLLDAHLLQIIAETQAGVLFEFFT